MDPFVEQHNGLVTIHHALNGSLLAVAAATTIEILVPQALAAGGFLHGHHEAERTILFPGLRKYGRLKSTDIAFLEDCSRAHHELHALCDRLVAAAQASHPDAKEIARLARDTQQGFAAHVAEEEAGLSPERLREMISLEGLLEIQREAEAFRAARQR
jgi:hemerythrin-like domain-containing protein